MTPDRKARILQKMQAGRATRIERLILKQDGLCFYCWTALDRDVTKEHLHSKADGGSNEASNLRAAHMACNGIVGTLPVELKMELHEIGRDKGPDAFWVKAREYQEKYGREKNAYSASSKKARDRAKTRRQLQAEASLRRSKLAAESGLTPSEQNSEAQVFCKRVHRELILERESERRKSPEWQPSGGWRAWWRRIELLYGQPLARSAAAQQEASESVL